MRGEFKDTGVIPEGVAWEWVKNEEMPLRDIVEGKSAHGPDLAGAWEAADLVGKGTADELLALLKDPDPAKRFWGIIGLRNAAFADAAIHGKVIEHLDDVSADVRIEAASWLAHFAEYREASLARLVADLDDEEWCVALRACRAIELLGDKAASVKSVMRKVYDQTRNAPGDENFFLAFSSGAYLDALGEPTEPWDFSPGAGSFSADPKKDDTKK